jgi:hypothetical protein
MSESITLLPPAQIAQRMQACRDELRALRKLYRMSTAAKAADDARAKRAAVPDRRKEMGGDQ